MTYWFIFCKTDLLLQKQADGSYTIPCSEESPIELKPWTHVLNISPMEDGTAVKAFTIDTPVTDNPNYEMCGLRPSYYKLSRDLYLKAGKCHELIYWDQNTQFCGICGAPMKMSTDISKKCTQCGKSVWPSLATADADNALKVARMVDRSDTETVRLLDRITRLLDRLVQIDTGPLLEGIGAEVESQTRRRIQVDKASPSGKAWPEWSADYAETRHSKLTEINSNSNFHIY